jgi:DNA primase
LPDGALKRQLLTEIAKLVELGARELQDLWQPKALGQDLSGRKSYQKGSYSRPPDDGQGSFRSKSPYLPQSFGLRSPVASRADHAARILLGDPHAWDKLSGEDHTMLAEQPAPHGPLFAWIESQFHEHGPLPWGALREGLRDHPAETLALKLMSGSEMVSEVDPAEAEKELRQLLDRMLVERLGAQMNLAIEASKADPSALQRYRELQQRKQALEAGARVNSAAR